MTKPPLPTGAERLVINTGPLVALGRVGALDLVGALGLDACTPEEVAAEITAGLAAGHSVSLPSWVRVVALVGPLSAVTHALDAGEAAVIQLALERGIDDVCIDEWRGRRVARAAGLGVTGSLGLLGRCKKRGLISDVRPWIDSLAAAGVRYHPELLRSFLASLGEAEP